VVAFFAGTTVDGVVAGVTGVTGVIGVVGVLMELPVAGVLGVTGLELFVLASTPVLPVRLCCGGGAVDFLAGSAGLLAGSGVRPGRGRLLELLLACLTGGG